jgi:hypothetical protein
MQDKSEHRVSTTPFHDSVSTSSGSEQRRTPPFPPLTFCNDWATHRPRLDYARRLSQFPSRTPFVCLPCHRCTYCLTILWFGGIRDERVILGLVVSIPNSLR